MGGGQVVEEDTGKGKENVPEVWEEVAWRCIERIEFQKEGSWMPNATQDCGCWKENFKFGDLVVMGEVDLK